MSIRERKQLQAELEAMNLRASYCLSLLHQNDHKMTPDMLAEWSVAINGWSTLMKVLEYDLGGVPAGKLH